MTLLKLIFVLLLCVPVAYLGWRLIEPMIDRVIAESIAARRRKKAGRTK